MADGEGQRCRVAILIVNWNTVGLLRQCLESLRARLEAGTVEIVVVDNASHDGSADMVAAEFPGVQLIRNDENLGFCKGTNQAYAASTAEYALMLNSDTESSADAIEACVQYLDEHMGVGIVGCRLTYPDGSPQSSCFRFTNLWGVVLSATYAPQLFQRSYLLNRDRYGHRIWDEPQRVDCVMGSFLMVRRAAVESPQLLDEGYFMYGEEMDLCYRLHRAGRETVYLPQATAVHHSGGSTRSPQLRAWAFSSTRRAHLRFLAKWRGTAVAYAANLIMTVGMIPRLVVWTLADLVGSAVSLKPALRQSRKAQVLGFHLLGLVKPRVFLQEWGRHAAIGTARRSGGPAVSAGS